MTSYQKFNYLLRPAKQVERKLLIEGLHHLSSGGFRIRDYRYIGFGSPFFADFTLFHKYLYVDDAICVERTSIARRMRFNRPFAGLKLRMNEVSEIIADVDRKKRHLVWLDYDYPLNESVLLDVAGFAAALARESIVIVTVEADPRTDDDLPRDLAKQVREFRRQEVEDQIGQFVSGGIKPAHLSPKKLAEVFARVLIERFKDELAIRSLEFIPLFNFCYADGRQMLSVGGMFGDPVTALRVRSSGVYDLPFVQTGIRPSVIKVPPLTSRERLWLDQNPMRRNLPFEVSADEAEDYRRFYRHYPSYFEALL